MVCPDIEVTTSPGLVALLPGMFSAAATMPTTLIGRSSSASVCIKPNTVAAPHISNFISSIPAPGFNEMPPVSKVMPLPMSTIGFLLAAAPLYCMAISFASSALPAETESSEPMPSFFISVSPKTSTDRRLLPFLMAFASFARCVGVQILAGRSLRFLVIAIPEAMALPCAQPVCIWREVALSEQCKVMRFNLCAGFSLEKVSLY